MFIPHKSTSASQATVRAPGFERHMLVWLEEDGWRAVQHAARKEHRAALKLWEGQDWPAVVRRTDVDTADDEICLGLPLPPDEDTGQKVRIALHAHVGHISKAAPAVHLRGALRSSGPWREPLAALERDSAAAGLGLRVYGSLAMQALTGLLYVSPTSDVDVLFHPTSRKQLDEGVALLWRHSTQLPLDGEIVFPGGQAVSWKEWQMAMAHPAKVIVKELQSVRLADTDSLLATLGDG
jgi:phosphoribosyl-dephospho-CoA transferase